MSRIDCILYPPTLDYNYLVQRPQQLMKNFSQLGIPSFFLNVPSPHLNQNRGIENANENLYIFNHVDPRPYLKGRRPVVYFSAAWHIDMVKQYNPALLVFDSVDEPSNEFEAWKPYYFRAVSLADVVLNTSDKLYEMSRKINPSSFLVPNGCDYDYFSQAAGKNLPLFEDIASINHPIIGYIGVIASWLDLQLIDRVAQKFPHCNVVMIGPLYNVSQIPHRPNLHWLGFKPYEQLAAYSQCFDVGMVPFMHSSMVESVNPIKMWEYMAAGMPVVTTAIPEASKYPELVLYSADSIEFLNNINQALYSDSLEKRQLRMAVAEQNSWRHRAQQVVDILEQTLLEKDRQPQERGRTAFNAAAARAPFPQVRIPAPSISTHRRINIFKRPPMHINGQAYTAQAEKESQKAPPAGMEVRITGQTAFHYSTFRVR